MPRINALIVDDDKMVRQAVACALPPHGVNVLAAATTAEADAILEQEKVDVIVCDVLMDPEDGLSYCKRLRDAGNQVPVLFLSALTDQITMTIGMTSGAAAYLTKPFDIQDLSQRIFMLVGPRPTYLL